MKTKRLSPRHAVTSKDTCSLNEDNTDTREGWLMIDGGTVILSNQLPGESQTGKVEFSRRAFNSLIDWYNAPQVLSRKP